MGLVGDFLDLFLNETSFLFIDLMYKDHWTRLYFQRYMWGRGVTKSRFIGEWSIPPSMGGILNDGYINPLFMTIPCHK